MLKSNAVNHSVALCPSTYYVVTKVNILLDKNMSTIQERLSQIREIKLILISMCLK